MAENAPVVVVLDQFDSYHTRILAGLRTVLADADLPAIVHGVPPFQDDVPESLRQLITGDRISGVVATHLALEQQHRDLLELLRSRPELPLAFLGEPTEGACRVAADNDTGMRQLIGHLMDDVGVRRPVLIRGIRHQPDSRRREQVLRAELAERGIAIDESLVLDGEFTRDTAYRLLLSLVRRRRDFDAVIAFNDRMALGAYDALADAGIRIPQDVAVSGFDDETLARFVNPPLTSVNQDLFAQGVAVGELLLAKIAGADSPMEVLIPSQLVIRGSTTTEPPLQGLGADPRRDPSQAELAAMDTTLEMNRAFMGCRTVADVVNELSFSLPRLGVSRCFLVLNEDDDDPSGAAMGRLALSFRDGRAAPLADDVRFPLIELLPGLLQAELARGMLLLQPLSVAEAEFGFILFDQTSPNPFTGEVLRMDLSRALDALARNERLAVYAEELERLVAQRTAELESEVATRRRAETELKRANAELRRSLFMDGLTGIANRTHLDEHLAQSWARHLAGSGVMSVVLVDVDHFKAYNDRYGHLRGDDCLRMVASCLQDAVRGQDDLVARYGGEEFAVVLPGTGPEGAMVVAERMRRMVRDAGIPHSASPVAEVVTVSLGVATMQPVDGLRLDDLIALADQALYRAKELGRDRVVQSRAATASPASPAAH